MLNLLAYVSDPAARAVGHVIGIALGVLIIIGIPVLFVVALVQAIRTGRKAWIITVICSGLPILALVVAIMVGIIRGVSGVGPGASGHKPRAIELLTAPMSPVTGSDIAYSISYPALESWNKEEIHNTAFDQLYSIHDGWVGVIPEQIGMGTPQKACALVQKKIAKAATEHTFTPTCPIQIDGRGWLTFDATVVVNGIPLKYRYYIYTDGKNTFQIMAWGGNVVFDAMAPVFDRVAQSFKMPP